MKLLWKKRDALCRDHRSMVPVEPALILTCVVAVPPLNLGVLYTSIIKEMPYIYR